MLYEVIMMGNACGHGAKGGQPLGVDHAFFQTPPEDFILLPGRLQAFEFPGLADLAGQVA